MSVIFTSTLLVNSMLHIKLGDKTFSKLTGLNLLSVIPGLVGGKSFVVLTYCTIFVLDKTNRAYTIVYPYGLQLHLAANLSQVKSSLLIIIISKC